MGVFQKIAQLVGSSSTLQLEVGSALAYCYTATARNSRRLLRLAELAPQEASTQALKELAASEATLSERLWEALKASQPNPPRVTQLQETPPTSHWGRLVQALETQRKLVQVMREYAAEFADSFPETARLFDEARATEAMHCERLRDLIARADPQAMN